MIKKETVDHIMTQNVHHVEVSAGLKAALAIKKNIMFDIYR